MVNNKTEKNSYTSIFQWILLIYSYILYINYPFTYSYSYCISCLIIFIINALFVIRKSIKQANGLVTFDFFFTFAFFYTNYVYGVFMYLVNPEFSLFRLEFNDDYICKGVALSTLGYSAYALGRCKYLKNNECKSLFFKVSKIKSHLINKIIIYFSIIVIIITIPKIGQNYETDGLLDYGFIGNYIYMVLFICIYFWLILTFYDNKNNIRIVKDNFKIFFLIFILNLFLLLIGSRTIPLRLIILIIYLYNLYISPIKKKYIIIGGFIGFFLMYIIGAYRGDGRAAYISDNPIFEIGKELIINNRSLFVLIEYADTKGYTYGQTLLMNLLSVVPFLQSIVLFLTGWKLSDISSANLVTDLHFEDKVDEKVIGLGTNLIGDIYVCFGAFGVIILMFYLGHYLNKLSIRNDLKSVIIYSMFICNSIYYTRSGILTPIREIVWIIAIFYWSIMPSTKKNNQIINQS